MRSLSAAAKVPDISFISGPFHCVAGESRRGDAPLSLAIRLFASIATGALDIVSMSQCRGRFVMDHRSLFRRLVSSFGVEGMGSSLERRARQRWADTGVVSARTRFPAALGGLWRSPPRRLQDPRRSNPNQRDQPLRRHACGYRGRAGAAPRSRRAARRTPPATITSAAR